MLRRSRRNHTPVFKSKVALAAINGDKTVAQQFDVGPIKGIHLAPPPTIC